MFTPVLIKKLIVTSLGIALATGGMAASAQAATLTFDSLPGNEVSIPEGYGGFTWNNFYTVSSSAYPGSGYDRGTISPGNVALNGYGNPAFLQRSSAFDFNSAYLTAAWSNDLSVLVQGFLGSSLKYTAIVTLSTTTPVRFDFNFLGIDQLQFISAQTVRGSQFAMDNFTYSTPAPNSEAVPEPTTLAGLALAGAGLAAARRRQHRSQNSSQKRTPEES